MWLNTLSSPTVRHCNFQDNGGVAVNAVRLEAVSGFAFNTASGNAGGDYMRVTSANFNTAFLIEDHSVLEGALVVATGSGVSIGAGGHLTAGPGVVFKMVSGGFNLATPSAQLTLEGTAARPVVATSFLDDSIAGDTNGDGAATTPGPGNWTNISILSGSASLTHALLRYGGAPSLTPVATIFANFTAGLSVDNVRVEYGAGPGFELRNAQKIDRACAYANQRGFLLTSGLFDLTRCTAVASGPGFQNTGGHVGAIINSIDWGSSPNFAGIAPVNLRFSDGDMAQAGSNGNINSDPLFMNQAGGDLRLMALSPCVDTGDPLSEQDPDCTPADMGAHWYDQGGPLTYCSAKVNTQVCEPFVDYLGYASATDTDEFRITGNDVLNNKPGLFFYGYTGPFAGPFEGGTLCVFPPLRRTDPIFSAGNSPPNDCSGTYTFDFNARIQSGADPLLMPGGMINGQFWSRDPQSSNGVGLTNGIQFSICP